MEFDSKRTACTKKKEAEILPLFATQYFHLQAPSEGNLNRGLLTHQNACPLEKYFSHTILKLYAETQ